MIADGAIILGAGLTLVPNFVSLCIGRVIYGLAVGGFSVFCPKFIAETAPIEVKGPAGALSQICITFGILVAFMVGLGIGDVDTDDVGSFEIQSYWYIIFAIPIIIALLQILLLLTLFPYDTPVMLKTWKKDKELKELMTKIYIDEKTADERIALIKVEEPPKEGDEENENDPSCNAVCCSPRYARASWIGCLLSVFQQLTGINAIMFYSNIIFKGLSMTNTMVTALVGIVNFIATLGGLVLLFFFGRRFLLFSGSVAMSVTLLLLSTFAFMHESIGMVVSLLLFIVFFELSTGPILWLYMAEIMRDKALAVGASLNWTVSLIISLSVPFLLKVISVGVLFLIFAILTIIGTIFIWFFVKETRGLTQEEIDAQFRDDLEEKTEK